MTKPKPLNFERARSEIRKEVLEWLYKDKWLFKLAFNLKEDEDGKE